MPLSLQQTPFVVVDLETTGGSATFDRITEVAAVRIRGGEVEDRFATLVNPGVSIPPFITRLTGITDAMVRGKPPIERVLPRLASITEDAVFVAHNVSFDHGFVSNAFRRVGDEWSAERLCTLKLARRLIPGLHSYRLDSLCAHLGFSHVQGHRAAADADATVALLTHLFGLAEERGLYDLSALLAFQQAPVTPRRGKTRVDEARVASLPTGPGVYLLKDERGHVLYIGKSVNVRQRVRQHLRPSGTAAAPAQPALRKRLPYIADVEVFETGSELEALFLESRLVKRYLPDANRQLRDFRDYSFIKVDLAEPYPRLEVTRERPTNGAVFFGPFRRASTVASAVLFLSESLGLRQCHGRLTPGQSACALLDMRKCLGPCVGAVNDLAYRAAVNEAVRVLRGEDDALLARARERMEALADALRFEEAAEVRDRIHDVEALVRAHRRLEAFVGRNVVVVVHGAGPGRARLFVVKAGRVVREETVSVAARAATLERLLTAAYAEPTGEPITREQVDEMLILDRWLRERSGTTGEVVVDPVNPAAAVPALRAALGQLVSVAA